MTDLEKLISVYDDVGIDYSINTSDFPYEHIEMFLHNSNITFCFNLDGEYRYSDISY